ncbi:Uncharacterised protein [uncultured archaeon]|nr:Uncharacterised protein [uncultured archaeon]
MIPTNSYQRTVRGPYFSDRTESDPTGPRTEVRPESTHAINYSVQYGIHLRKMFKGNNGRTSGGLQ